MADTTVDTTRDTQRVRPTETAPGDRQPTGADADRIRQAADAVPATDVVAQANLTAGREPSPDTYGVAEPAGVAPADGVNGVNGAKDNPASFLADTTLTPAQMSERLRGMTTEQLTSTVQGVDRKDMGYGKKVTPEGWKALHGELDRRFTEATANRSFTDPALAELSQATVRQNQFGEQSRPWSEKQWRDLATSETAIARRSDETAQRTYQTLQATQRLVSHQINGSTPPSEMTNAQLLRKVEQIPGMRAAGEVIAATGIPGMLAQGLGDAKADATLAELDRRFSDGRIDRFEPNRGTDGNVGTALGVASTIAQLGNPRNWIRNGVQGVKRLFGRGAKDAAPDAGDAARLRGALRETDAVDGLRRQGFDVRRWNQELGTTEIDLMMTTGRGRYGVLVGGNAKAMKNGRIDDDVVKESVERFRRANEYLTDPDGPFRGDGAGAIMAFPKNTDPRVIERFVQELGRGRVMTF